ncbi:hypothetical protein [Halalkalibacter alkaliphilus]|nr:hypothetical protein [Halalkalibacter alkaliphilus]
MNGDRPLQIRVQAFSGMRATLFLIRLVIPLGYAFNSKADSYGE